MLTEEAELISKGPIAQQRIGIEVKMGAGMAGDAGETRWHNQIAPRGLLQMTRYRPALDAGRLQAPLLVCVAVDDTETPEAMATELAVKAPRGTLLR